MSEATLKALTAILSTLSDENLNKAKEFAETLIKNALPTTMTVGGRTYDILGFLYGDEYINGNTMINRVKKMEVNVGQEDCKFIMDHQKDIPHQLEGKIYFVFSDWRHPGVSEDVACVYWGVDRWIQDWFWLGSYWGGHNRVLRRK